MVFFPLLIIIILTISIIKKRNLKAKFSKLFLGSILVILTMLYTTTVNLVMRFVEHMLFNLESILFVSAFPIMMGLSIFLHTLQIDN